MHRDSKSSPNRDGVDADGRRNGDGWWSMEICVLGIYMFEIRYVQIEYKVIMEDVIGGYLVNDRVCCMKSGWNIKSLILSNKVFIHFWIVVWK